MDAGQIYGNMVRNELKKNHPEKAGKMIRTGLRLEQFRCTHFKDKRMPKAYGYLNMQAIKVVADCLDHPKKTVLMNIFAPAELFSIFGLGGVSMECLASYLSGFHLEDYFIDAAENSGIATTLCAYHKNFLGAVESGMIGKPLLGVTTSTVCDGNVNTFRMLKDRYGIEDFVLDIPHTWSEEAEEYVVGQLKQLVSILEKKTGVKYDEDALKKIIRRENASKKEFREALEKRKTHAYPNTLVLVLFMLFATHLDIGSQWVWKFFHMMNEEIESYPEEKRKKIFWIHLTPYWQPTLQKYLNYNPDYAIFCDDFNLDYMETMDADHPLHALARKMIMNIYNGEFSRKTDACVQYVKEYGCDAVVEFCHWGCKQSSGGSQLMKEAMRKAGVPMLILDGDALDRRNSHDGQIRTRFEAFLELIGQK